MLVLQVKLVDAGFIWTEPHSRRLKTKLTVQSEVFNGAILQQTFVVEYVVETHMCTDCSKAAANPNQWTAVCQAGPCILLHYCHDMLYRCSYSSNYFGAVHNVSLQVTFVQRDPVCNIAICNGEADARMHGNS